MSLNDCVLVNARFVLPRSILVGGAVVVRAGRIQSVLEAGDPLPADLPRRDLGGAYVSPGLVDFHLHGIDGLRFDALDADPLKAAEELLRARESLRSRGVTCFLPTLICGEESVARLAAAIEYAGLAEDEVPGIYIEGPFVSRRRPGRMPAWAIHDPDTRELGRLINLCRGRLRAMTVAPELPGAREIVARLSAVGALPCLGHSDCRLDRVTLPEGRFAITHLFNAMSPFSHREQGLAMLPFLDHRPFVELIPDARRVNEAALRVCASAIDPDRLMLVSDAGGSVPGAFMGQEGGSMVGAELLSSWLKLTGSSPANALRLLTLTPAQALGLDTVRGAIAPGMRAEFVVWGEDFRSVVEIL